MSKTTKPITAPKLRLIAKALANGMSVRRAALEADVSPASVSRQQTRMKIINLTWSDVQRMDDEALEKALHPSKTEHVPINLPLIYEKLHADHKLTELNAYNLFYKSVPASEGQIYYSYQHFCALYSEYCEDTRGEKPNGHLQHTDLPFENGQFMEIDFAGDLLTWYEPTGIKHSAHLFVACFRTSLFTYVEAFDNEKTDAWIAGTSHAFEYAKGVPALISFDNARALVRRADKDVAVITCALNHLCTYYKMRPHSNPVYSPKFKSGVERACGMAETEIIAILRARGPLVARDLKQVNEFIRPLLDGLNAKSFTNKNKGSRLSLFTKEERPQLHRLPGIPYEPGHWRTVTADVNYKVKVDQTTFTVKHTAAGKKLWVRTTPTRYEFYRNDTSELVGNYMVYEIKFGKTNTKDEYLSKLDKAIRGTLEDTKKAFEEKGYLRPFIGKFLENLFAQNSITMNRYKYIKGLRGLCCHYGADLVERICKFLDSQGALDDYAAVKELVRREVDRINERKGRKGQKGSGLKGKRRAVK